MSHPILSIIIPLYEPKEADILRCLSSIYKNAPEESLFEVICVDDCSPSSRPKEIISSFAFDGHHPANLIYARTPANVRQGGARNHGMEMAEGSYIGCIDQDDYFTSDALNCLIDSTSLGLDMAMFNFSITRDDGKTEHPYHYPEHNSRETISGVNFLKKQEVSWFPWNYIYRKEFLLKNNLKFEPYVRFEDVDFILHSIALAQSIKFIPETTVVHTETSTQTSAVGNNREKNRDLVKIASRVGKVAELLHQAGNKGWKHVLNHHRFMYEEAVKKNIWRLPYSDIKDLLINYPPSSLISSGLSKSPLTSPSAGPVLIAILAPCLKSVDFLYRNILKK